MKWLTAGAKGFVIAVAAITLSACAAGTPAQAWDPQSVDSTREHARAEGYTEAVKVLEDGHVTREEWLSMHKLWVQCESKLGFEFEPPLLDPVNGREYLEPRTYHGPGNAPDDAKSSACDNRYDFSVGQIYYNDTPAQMDPKLMSAVHACLKTKGYKFKGNEKKFEDFFAGDNAETAQAGANGPVGQCVKDGVFKLYPGIPAGLGF